MKVAVLTTLNKNFMKNMDISFLKLIIGHLTYMFIAKIYF